MRGGESNVHEGLERGKSRRKREQKGVGDVLGGRRITGRREEGRMDRDGMREMS